MPALDRMPLVTVATPKDFTGDNALGIYTAEAIKRFRFGTRHITWDGRVFKYAKAGGTINADLLAQSIVAQHVSFQTNTIAHPAGAKRISITVGATDGTAAGGAIAADELEGGYVIIFSDVVATMNRGIVGNLARAAGGGQMLVDLDFPTHVAIAASTTYTEAMASPYSSIKASTTGDAARSFIGLPMAEATTGQHLWIQTWGPCWIAPQSNVGAVGHSNQIVARYDGSIQKHEQYTAGDTPTATEYTNGVEQQHIGFVLSRAANGTQGAPFVMLQISV